MTSSETPSEPEAPAAEPVAETAAPPVAAPAAAVEPVPRARAVGKTQIPPWALAAAVIPPGWFFVMHQSRWHLTASAVLLMLCWVAIVGIGYAALRMALAAAATDDDRWFAVTGKRDELEREKRTLLKAIKEIEFDHQTGKLSDADAAALTASYRARAIEVIKAIETEAGEHQSVREKILAEVKARATLDAKVTKAKAGKNKGKKEKAA